MTTPGPVYTTRQATRRGHFLEGAGGVRLPMAIDAVGPGSMYHVTKDRPKEDWHVREVPVEHLRATQERLSEDHYTRIAQTPKAKMDQRKKMPRGYEHPDGSVWLGDGHHRAAAAIARGDRTTRVEIRGEVQPEFHDFPPGGRWEYPGSRKPLSGPARPLQAPPR